MSNCSTLEKAMEKLIQYHDIASNSIKLCVERQREYTELILKSEMQIRPDMDRIFLEAALTSCAIVFRDFTMGKVKFIEVHFTHPGPMDLSDYHRVFDCPVRILFGNPAEYEM